jgi:hypothetical protein
LKPEEVHKLIEAVSNAVAEWQIVD